MTSGSCWARSARRGRWAFLIPPSITLILIGLQTGQSVGRLFMGGLIAGLLLLAMFIAYVAIKARLNPALAPASETLAPMSERIRSLNAVILPLVVIVSVLVSIFARHRHADRGRRRSVRRPWCFRSSIRRELNWRYVREVCADTASVTGMVIWIVFGASAFRPRSMAAVAARVSCRAT